MILIRPNCRRDERAAGHVPRMQLNGGAILVGVKTLCNNGFEIKLNFNEANTIFFTARGAASS